MNIKQALKKKNLLVENIRQEFNRLNTYNSIESGNKRAYAPKECLDNYLEKTEELVLLKSAIHKANQPVYENIFKLSEYKSVVEHLKTLNCTEGKIGGKQWEYRLQTDIIPVYNVMEVEIDILTRDKLISNFENKINEIQDILDNFNQVTEI
jgi:hypothetical protein